MKASVRRCLFMFSTLLVVAGCHHGPKLTAWGSGDPGAPADVGSVYKAVLDEIFPVGSEAPGLIVVTASTEPSIVEIDVNAKRPHRRPDVAVGPFSYRIPIAFADTITLAELFNQARIADSISFTLPTTDPRRYQGPWAPFIKRYPGAWGRFIFGRVGFGPDMSYALVEVRYSGIVPGADGGREMMRLSKSNGTWRVVERIPREGVIEAKPLTYRMLHGWVDSSTLPPPNRRALRGTVTDSLSGAPIPSFMIRVENIPSDRPESYTVLFTDSRGMFETSDVPGGYALIHAECPPVRGVNGARLATAVLPPESGIDTVLNFRVRYSRCAELAPAMAREAKQHEQDVARAKAEAAARAVQGNIWGTLRDSRTGRPVPRATIRIDKSGGLFFSDSLGRFWLWGFAPGRHQIIVRCPARRTSFVGTRIATTVAIVAPPAMKDTMDIRVDMNSCVDVPLDTVQVRTAGVWSLGFEDGFFTPCIPFTQIELGAYEDWSHLAYVKIADSTVSPPGGWPEAKPVKGYIKIFMEVEGDLIGPGSYGHMGIATYLLRVKRVLRAQPATSDNCSRSHRAVTRSR